MRPAEVAGWGWHLEGWCQGSEGGMICHSLWMCFFYNTAMFTEVTKAKTCVLATHPPTHSLPVDRLRPTPRPQSRMPPVCWPAHSPAPARPCSPCVSPSACLIMAMSVDHRLHVSSLLSLLLLTDSAGCLLAPSPAVPHYCCNMMGNPTTVTRGPAPGTP